MKRLIFFAVALATLNAHAGALCSLMSTTVTDPTNPSPTVLFSNLPITPDASGQANEYFVVQPNGVVTFLFDLSQVIRTQADAENYAGSTVVNVILDEASNIQLCLAVVDPTFSPRFVKTDACSSSNFPQNPSSMTTLLDVARNLELECTAQ